MNKAQIEHLINKIFKILPLGEEGNENIKDYIGSVMVQVNGAAETSKDFFSLPKNREKLIDISNSINYLKTNEFTLNECRREVFKCTGILARMKED